MHNNFETLQKQYRSYRFKQLTKKLFPLILLLIVLGLGIYMYLQPIEHTEVTTPTIIKKEMPLVQVPVLKSEPITQSVIVDQTDNKVIKDVTYDLHVDETYTPSNKRVASKPKQEIKSHPSVTASPIKQLIADTPVPEVTITATEPKPTSNLTMSIKKVQSVDEIIALYDKEPSYAQALKIAQGYFDLEKYSNASLWAKKANMLDREADGAWILYAKSEYAKGNHQRAIEILKLYVANATSHDADELLMTWTQGE